MKRISTTLAAAFSLAPLLLCAPALGAQESSLVAIRGGTVYTMAGPPVHGGTVLIRDGKIAEVGRDVRIPSDATVVDASGKSVLPGLVDAMTYYGISPRDLNETTRPLTPEVRILEAYYPFGDFGRGRGEPIAAVDLLSGGVTTQYIGPGDQTVVGGQGAVVKTAAPTFDDLIVREPAAIDMTLGSRPTKTFEERNQVPTTRMGLVTQIRELLLRAQEYQRQMKEYAALPTEEKAKRAPPHRDLGLEAMGLLLDRKIPARIQANRQTEIRVAMDLAEEFGFDWILDGGAQAYAMKQALANKGIPVVLGPVSHPYISGEEIPDRDEYPAPDERSGAWLTEAGVTVAYGSFSHGLGSLAQGITGRWILLDAAIAEGYGMSEEDVLRAVTLNGAKILGVDDRVGSLEPGKDADIVLMDGPPLSVRTWVEKVWVDGRPVYSRADASPHPIG